MTGQGTDLRVQQNIFRKLTFLGQQCLVLGYLALFLGYQSSVRCGSLFLQWALGQIRRWLDAPTILWTIALAYFSGKTDFRSKVLWLGWCPHSPFSSLQNTFPHKRDKNGALKASFRDQLKFSMFNDLCGCFWQWGSTIGLWREPSCLSNSLGCLRIFGKNSIG